MQRGSVRVIVLVLQFLLKLPLLLGRFPSVFGCRRRVDVDLLIHARSPSSFDGCSWEDLPDHAIRNRTVTTTGLIEHGDGPPGRRLL
ncbi:hypothetical protein A5712_07115 [Mycobacterium sp. E2327]|nr:hypothetical protein A5712_07115 [Mycobacterium sp. E2327]